MQKQTIYQQLQPEDRITLATMRQRGFSVRAIPVRLNEHRPPLLASWPATPMPDRRMVRTKRNCGLQPVAVMPGATASCMCKVCAGAW